MCSICLCPISLVQGSAIGKKQSCSLVVGSYVFRQILCFRNKNAQIFSW